MDTLMDSFTKLDKYVFEKGKMDLGFIQIYIS